MSQETNSYPLNSQQEQEFSNFQALLTSWAGAYPFFMISYVAVRTARGPRLIFGRILLLPSRNGINATQFKFETEHIIAARLVSDMTVADTGHCLEKAKTGKIPAFDGAMTIELERDGNLSVYFDPITSRFLSMPEGKRSPCLVLHGISRWTLLSSSLGSRPLDQLNWELKTADMPFDNLDELLTCCNLPTMMQTGELTMFEVVASSPTWIGNESTIMNGEARIECHVASALDTGKIRVGYIVIQKDSLKRTSVDGSIFQWQQENDLKIGTCRIPVGDAPSLQAFLSYKGVCLHQRWVKDPQKYLNPRQAVHQVFDKNMGFLESVLLNSETNKAKEFEDAVSTLFHVLGFSVVNYGRIPKFQEGPDIIAISPAGHIGVIECTVGPLNEKKIDYLFRRTKLIKEKLISAGYGDLQIQPAIATPCLRDKVGANLKAAGEHSIAVICSEEIKKLLTQANLPPNAEGIFEGLERMVPGVNEQPSF